MVHLHPLLTGLHGEDQARIWFALSITVRNSFTAQLEFHFGQIRTIEQAKRVSCWFVDVTHGWRRTEILWIRIPNKFSGKWKLWMMIYLNSIQFYLMPYRNQGLDPDQMDQSHDCRSFMSMKWLLHFCTYSICDHCTPFVFSDLILFYLINLYFK